MNGVLADGLSKYIQYTLSIITLGITVAAVIYFWHRLEVDRQERLMLESRYNKLVNTTMGGGEVGEKAFQSHTKYVDGHTLESEAAINWPEVEKRPGERHKLMGSSEVQVEEHTSMQEASDYEFLTEKETNGFHVNELRVDGPKSPPIGFILVRKDGKVSKKTYDFRIRLESIQLKDDLTGEIRVVTKAFLVSGDNGLANGKRADFKKWKGLKYPLNVTGGEVTVDPQEASNPEAFRKGLLYLPMNLSLGLGVSGNRSVMPTLDAAFLGYGKNKRDLDWKLLQIGVNYSDKGLLGLHLIPGSYRPFMEALPNTYLGPGWWNLGGESGYFLGINVGF